MAEDPAHDLSENAHRLLSNGIETVVGLQQLALPGGSGLDRENSLDLAIGLANATLEAN
jgi:hypothetical protein